MTPNVHHAIPIDDLRDGESRGLDVNGRGQDTVFIVRHRGRLHAYEDRCPHYGDTPLAWRRHAYLNGDRSRIVCAAHGAQFDIETGECVLGPCLGQRLTPVPVERLADGRALVSVALALALAMPIPT